MKLLGSTESKITGEKNSENVPHLEVIELVLIQQLIIIDNIDTNYQQNSRILYAFVPSKPFGSLLEISPPNHNKYGQKLADSAKKSATDAFKIASKRAIQKTAEATGDLIGNTIADKIASYSKKTSK